MIQKIKNIFYFAFFLIFIIFITNFYFSDENIKKISKSRSFYAVKKINDDLDLPLLKNYTNNIIEYRYDINFYKNKKKKIFFFRLNYK